MSSHTRSACIVKELVEHTKSWRQGRARQRICIPGRVGLSLPSPCTFILRTDLRLPATRGLGQLQAEVPYCFSLSKSLENISSGDVHIRRRVRDKGTPCSSRRLCMPPAISCSSSSPSAWYAYAQPFAIFPMRLCYDGRWLAFTAREKRIQGIVMIASPPIPDCLPSIAGQPVVRSRPKSLQAWVHCIFSRLACSATARVHHSMRCDMRCRSTSSAVPTNF